jgi:hypothetical protein
VDGIWSLFAQAGHTSGVKNNVYVADLTAAGVNLPAPILSLFAGNRRAIRARYPSANPEWYGLHTGVSGCAAV